MCHVCARGAERLKVTGAETGWKRPVELYTTESYTDILQGDWR